MKKLLLFLVFTFKCVFALEFWPIQVGNEWIFETTPGRYHKIIILSKFEKDTTIFQYGSGLSDPDDNGALEVFGLTVWWFQEEKPSKIYLLTGWPREPIIETRKLLYDFSDPGKIDTNNATINTPIGEFRNCLKFKNGECYANGFGPVFPSLVYARVGHLVYGEYPPKVKISKRNSSQLSFVLHPCFPNPFNQSTQIKFEILKAEFTTLRIINFNGDVVKVLLSSQLSSGIYTINWDGTNETGEKVATGTYLIELKTNSETKTMKTSLVR
ncbi:MAG: T9SS type A sorting domain-containing protein [Marinilabiliaceae bacterium]|nr:T9SS type A sorting domain-containing protein [Marinilabiliaceae bacterium]